MVGLSVARIVDCTAIVLLAIRLEAAEHVQIDELAALEGLVWVVGIQDRGFIFPLFFTKIYKKLIAVHKREHCFLRLFQFAFPIDPTLRRNATGTSPGRYR